MRDVGPIDPPSDEFSQRVIRNHRRFALTEVTLDGNSVGGATIDAWQEDAERQRWSVRVLMTAAHATETAEIVGRLRDGRFVRGRVKLIGPGPAPRPRGAALYEWHGVGELRLEGPSGES